MEEMNRFFSSVVATKLMCIKLKNHFFFLVYIYACRYIRELCLSVLWYGGDTGRVPLELSRLTRLRVLNLRENDFTGERPTAAAAFRIVSKGFNAFDSPLASSDS